ncbi:unnamed protein product [Symbiodinium sp. CCMP2592]|nr:unnamed protein product [Symbiodinium sp. CCMP2592]
MRANQQPRRQDQRAQWSAWPSYANSPALQWNQGQPTANTTNLTAIGRMNAGLSGPLAFDPDTSSAYEALQPQPSTQDFSQDPAEEPTVQALADRLRALEVGILEADRRGAQQALWHHSRRAHEQPRLPCLLSPWVFISAKVDAVKIRLDQVYIRLAGLLLTLQQAFPPFAAFFTEAAVDACQYQGPSALLDSEGDPEA